jgi:hydrogenase 3 maturation protease
MPDLREQLQHCFRGRVCVMGLGNIDYGDDGFGVYLAESIATRLAGSGNISLACHVINAGTTPERLIGSVKGKGYDHLLFLDAVEFGGEPGSILLLNADETAARFPQISTHKMSIGLLARYIKTGEGTMYGCSEFNRDRLNLRTGFRHLYRGQGKCLMRCCVLSGFRRTELLKQEWIRKTMFCLIRHTRESGYPVAF